MAFDFALGIQYWSKASAGPQAAIAATFFVVTVLYIANLFKDLFEEIDAGTLATVSTLGEDYLTGGIEYYEKLVRISIGNLNDL